MAWPDPISHFALTPKQVFEKRGGVCIDAANFACALLTRAGYDDVHTLTVENARPSLGSGPRHTVAVVKERGKIYRLADTRCLGLVVIFQSYRDVANSLGGGYYFIDGRIYGWF